ncbi:MAG: DUF202 domain-containing protein [Candidatus Aenigmarchaeota archaeon]|nr:DUF202 domain-containing protein [Candidatus Aenigmarchaeota archaeon]
MPKKFSEGGEARLLLVYEQTILSKERTALSFMQIGLVFVGLGLGLIAVYLQNHIIGLAIGFFLIIVGWLEMMESHAKLKKYGSLLDEVKAKLRKIGVEVA